MTTTSDDIGTLFNTALQNATGAGTNVFGPRDWPTSIDEMPIVLIQSPIERKEGLGPHSAPQFNVATTIRVTGRMTSPADTGDAGAAAVQSALGALQRQIEVAVINYTPLMSQLQQFKSVDVKTQVTSNAEQHVGEVTLDFVVEFYQGPEDFYQPTANPLEELAIYADLVNVFSPTGTFTGQEPFTDGITTSPRTAGPDGRPEAQAVITLPQ